jgi:hypothetical protein
MNTGKLNDKKTYNSCVSIVVIVRFYVLCASEFSKKNCNKHLYQVEYYINETHSSRH